MNRIVRRRWTVLDGPANFFQNASIVGLRRIIKRAPFELALGVQSADRSAEFRDTSRCPRPVIWFRAVAHVQSWHRLDIEVEASLSRGPCGVALGLSPGRGAS